MKNSTKLVFTRHHNRFLTVLTVTALLLAAAGSLRAQYTLIPGTDALNIYFNDGSSTFFGTFDPGPYLSSGTGTPVNPSDLSPGSQLTSTFFSAAKPGGPISGSYATGAMTTPNAVAVVNYVDTPFFGSNLVNQTSLTPVDMTAAIQYFGTGTAELRLDWTAQYTFFVPGGAVPVAAAAWVPLSLSVDNWIAISAQLSYYDVTSPATSVASVTFGGDYASPADYPASLFALAPSATFFGFKTPLLFGGQVANNIIGATINPANGDTIEVVGYIDILVDPGSVQLTMLPAPPPAIIGAQLSGTNLVLQATNGVAGVTYVTCRSRNLAAPLNTWLPVATNFSSTTGNFTIIATNAVNPALQKSFYFLMAE